MAPMKTKTEGRVRGSYGKAWSKLAGIPVTTEMLNEIGRCMAKVFAEEAVKDFEKRGWSQRDPKRGPPLRKSFKHKLRGKSTIEITCSFYGVSHLANCEVPAHPMPWLTQEAKNTSPTKYKLTPSERAARMKRGGKVLEGTRKPLVIPIESNGTVIFRTAPLKLTHAWVHPGVAKFTFVERGRRRATTECLRVLRNAAAEALRSGDPLK